MSELEARVRAIIDQFGTPIFEAVGGSDWRSDALLGLNATAFVLPFIAAILAIIAITSRDGSG